MSVRSAITSFLRFALRIFYRRIELRGVENIPSHGAVIFASNHPNGLLDPLFLLCFGGRPVSFLGKAPLFHYFFIGWFVRLFETIPVYRKQDGTSGSNRETFERARSVLHKGGSIAIFPEGTTHDDPSMRELKSGAARIAIGAAMDHVVIVPVGIYYTAKQTFRSSALVVFGEPLPVPSAAIDANGEPPHDEVDRLTSAIDAALDEVTLQADSQAALSLIGQAEDIFTADEDQPLAEEFELRRRFIEGYHYLSTNDPARLAKLQSQVQRFESELRRARIDVHELKPHISGGRLFRLLILLPLGVIGAIVNYPAYVLIRVLARRFSKGEGAVMATMKFVGALALYPLTYLVVSLVLGMLYGVEAALAALVSLPFIAYIALVVFEDADDVIGDARAIAHRMFRRYGYERLRAHRYAIKEELIAVAREMGV